MNCSCQAGVTRTGLAEEGAKWKVAKVVEVDVLQGRERALEDLQRGVCSKICSRPQVGREHTTRVPHSATLIDSEAQGSMQSTAAARGRASSTLDDRWVDDYVGLPYALPLMELLQRHACLLAFWIVRTCCNSISKPQLARAVAPVVQFLPHFEALTAACN